MSQKSGQKLNLLLQPQVMSFFGYWNNFLPWLFRIIGFHSDNTSQQLETQTVIWRFELRKTNPAALCPYLSPESLDQRCYNLFDEFFSHYTNGALLAHKFCISIHVNELLREMTLTIEILAYEWVIFAFILAIVTQFVEADASSLNEAGFLFICLSRSTFVGGILGLYRIWQ